MFDDDTFSTQTNDEDSINENKIENKEFQENKIKVKIKEEKKIITNEFLYIKVDEKKEEEYVIISKEKEIKKKSSKMEIFQISIAIIFIVNKQKDNPNNELKGYKENMEKFIKKLSDLGFNVYIFKDDKATFENLKYFISHFHNKIKKPDEKNRLLFFYHGHTIIHEGFFKIFYIKVFLKNKKKVEKFL
jgi:hypothetical protein